MKKLFDIEGTGQVREQVVTFLTAERGTGDEIFNMRAINNIREVEQQTGNLLLPSILEGFTSQMQEKLQEMSQNIGKGDAGQINRAAHAIKSMSANIGAEKVRIISSNMEAKCRGGELTDIDGSIASLSEAFEEFVEQFRMEIILNK